jgi:hypothetical protein
MIPVFQILHSKQPSSSHSFIFHSSVLPQTLHVILRFPFPCSKQALSNGENLYPFMIGFCVSLIFVYPCLWIGRTLVFFVSSPSLGVTSEPACKKLGKFLLNVIHEHSNNMTHTTHNIYIFIYMYIYMYVYIYVYIYVCIYILYIYYAPGCILYRECTQADLHAWWGREICYYRTPNDVFHCNRTSNMDFAKTTSETLWFCYYRIFLSF